MRQEVEDILEQMSRALEREDRPAFQRGLAALDALRDEWREAACEAEHAREIGAFMGRSLLPRSQPESTPVGERASTDPRDRADTDARARPRSDNGSAANGLPRTREQWQALPTRAAVRAVFVLANRPLGAAEVTAELHRHGRADKHPKIDAMVRRMKEAGELTQPGGRRRPYRRREPA